MVANGQELPPLTSEMINQGNAKHAEEYANVSKEETVALLRENGAFAANTIRGLSDEQLDRTAMLSLIGKPMSTEQLIHFLSLGEIERHGSNLRQALAR